MKHNNSALLISSATKYHCGDACLFINGGFCGNHRVFRENRGGITRRQQSVRGGGDFEIAAKDEGK